MAGEARAKLDEAERQLAAGRVGSAIFFVSRASRLAQTMLAEADLVAKSGGARFVKSSRANLRSAPDTSSEVLAVLRTDLPIFVEANESDWLLVRTVSGQVGWLRSDLVRAR
jgi:SH3-like domain-containing protein